MAVKLLRITEGHDIAFLLPEQLAETMRDASPEVTTNHQVDRRPHPHHLAVGRVRVGAAPGEPATSS